MSRSLLFLASLGHSGSTLLELLLGAHPRIVGLGEVVGTLDEAELDLPVCTCGAPATGCPIWGPIITRQRSTSKLSMQEAHRLLIERVFEVYGPEFIPLDASKHLPALKRVHQWRNGDVRVLFLLKDVRSYIASALKLPDREELGPITRVARRSALVRALQWYRNNRRYLEFFREADVNFFQLGYEEFCFRTEYVISLACRFIGVDFDERMLTPQTSQSHIVLGNPMRLDPRRRKGILYDTRWFHDWRIQMVSAAMPPLMKWNQANVYANLNQERVH